MPNRLSLETSPYLQQHADNPVDWQPWSPAALELARAQDKPILLSIGYSACHWCHVMAHESFEDEDVAALMNRLFVNIKVDREERPDIDQIYQVAQQMLTGRTGGWPLTMFLAPDGKPFFGGTYFPKAARYGLPSFPNLLERVAESYRRQRTEIAEQNEKLVAALASTLPAATGASEMTAAPLAAVREALAASYDAAHGGFGPAPKFPHSGEIAFLLRRYCIDKDEAGRDMALASLAHMAAGGIHDQLGGGFCRYSVDERWEIPHFEKMLYDNGPLLGLYADAWAISGEPLFKAAAEGIATWVLREMQSPEGGYYSSLDADSDGEEGKFYVWDRAEFERLLSADELALAAAHWGLNLPPNFEGKHWNLRVAQPVRSEDAARLETARQKLFAARAARLPPGRDEKILSSWNALMIEGMAHAARIFDRPDWLASARRAADFVRKTLWREGRLLATYKDGKAHLDAYLDDHAFLIKALLEMLQADYRAEDLHFARALADALLTDFEDREAGGFFFTRHDHETLIHRPKPGHDNATPAGNGVAALVLQRLAMLTGAGDYARAATATLRLFFAQLHRGGHASMIQALEEWLVPQRLIVLAGGQLQKRDWQRRLARLALVHTVVVAPDAAGGPLPEPLAKPDSTEVNAWVCSGVTCLAPISQWAELSDHLATLP